MSPDQTCITTNFKGSSSRSATRDYTEQREQNERERLALKLFGIIFLLAGVGPIIARARRKSEQNSNHEYSQTKTRRGDDHRSFLDVTLGETIDKLWGSTAITVPSPQDAQKNDVIEAEFKSVFFSRTSADRERIISHWMRAKSVSRTEAMRLAIEDWRRDNLRAG